VVIMDSMRPLLLFCSAALIFGGCRYDPNAHLYTTQEPLAKDLVGTYILKQQTATSGGLSALGGRLAVIRLAADGSFVAANVPSGALKVASEKDASVPTELLSRSGRWRIAPVGGVDNGFGEKLHWGVYLDSPTADVAPAGLTGVRPPYGLIFTLGDPDLGQSMILERQN
jgi:hypothetical protein